MFPLACRRLSTRSPQRKLVTFLIDVAKNLTIINSRKEFHSVSQLKKSSDSSPWGRQSKGMGGGAAGPTVFPLRGQIESEVKASRTAPIDPLPPESPAGSQVFIGRIGKSSLYSNHNTVFLIFVPISSYKEEETRHFG